MSYRKAVRDAVKAMLTGETSAGANVFTSLDRPLKPDELPAILIYTQTSKRGPKDNGRSFVPRIVTVTIEGAISSKPDTALDDAEDLAEAIEAIMEGDLTLGNVVTDTQWLQSVSDISSAGSTTLGVCMLEYDVTILTNERPAGEYEFTDDGFTEPPTLVEVEPTPIPPDVIGGPTPPPDTACGPDGCDIPAWGGEA